MGGSLSLFFRIDEETSPLHNVRAYEELIQTVSASSDKLLFALLESFKALSGYGVLVNTSFNLRGEPIVCTPKDAIETFLSTEIDILVLGNYVIQREDNMQLLSNYVNKNIE